MTEFLLLTLYAPAASWGEIAVGEARNSWDRPSRSAVLGLIGAALGITRDDQAGHDALDAGYGIAVRLDVAGASAFDYQTAQTASESEIRKVFGKDRPATRRELLSVAERQTILSRRELREDALATLCLWPRPDARWSLAELQHAIEQPVFTLYAGRKANVFGLPLAPSIVEAETLAEAFASRPAGPEDLDIALIKPRNSAWGREVAHDPLPAGVVSGLVPARNEVRRDASPVRDRWQFMERAVAIGLLPEHVTP